LEIIDAGYLASFCSVIKITDIHRAGFLNYVGPVFSGGEATVDDDVALL